MSRSRSGRLLAALIALALNGGDYSPPDAAADDAPGDDDDRPPLVSRAVAGTASNVTPSDVARRAVLVSSQRDVGLISLSTLDGAGPFENGLISALSQCRDWGDLKVLVDPGVCATDRVRQTCERHGFAFSKYRRGPDGRVVAEFYTDLYFRPASASVSASASASAESYSASAHTRGGSPSPKNST